MKKFFIVAVVMMLVIAGVFAIYRYVPLPREVTTQSGEHYKGTMKNGKFHGRGLVTYPPGPKYSNMRSYEGDFVNGKRHGHGTVIWLEGDKIEGEWQNDTIQGRGVMTCAPDRTDGLRSYEGDFVDGRFEGQGVTTWRDGRRYEGEFKGGQSEGQGVFNFAPDDADGFKDYKGEFVNGVFHGRGIMTWRDGTKYEGQWRDNQMHGRGVMTHVPSRENNFVQSYEGDFVVNRPDGWGTMTWALGLMKYEGQWREGRMHGQGTMTQKNGRKYEGIWKNGDRHNGVEYDADGREVQRFIDGRPQDGRPQNPAAGKKAGGSK